MARTPEFDRAEVVARARDLFWAHGYQGTSMRALADATGLKPGSLYAAFGSKEGIFREALDDYVARVKALAERMNGPRAILEGWFRAHVREASKGRRGCLLLNSVSESPQLDPESARAVRAELTQLERFFAHCVAEADREGEQPPEVVARLLVAALAGISAMSRAGVPTRHLKDVAACALTLV